MKFVKFVKKFMKKHKAKIKMAVKVLVVAKAVLEAVDVLLKVWEIVGPWFHNFLISVKPWLHLFLCLTFRALIGPGTDFHRWRSVSFSYTA